MNTKPTPIFDKKWSSNLLLPLSILYRIIIAFRNKLYDLGILKSTSVDAVVLSIGNLSTGGTGKTPVTISIAEHLQARGFSVAILSRGYGRRDSGRSFLVQVGHPTMGNPVFTGDEPALFVEKLSSIPCWVDANRVRGANSLIEETDVDIILLDDAFQHRALRRQPVSYTHLTLPTIAKV